MTAAERILNAVDPEDTVHGYSDAELATALRELEGRTWWNDFWLEIYELVTSEILDRHLARHAGNTGSALLNAETSESIDER